MFRVMEKEEDGLPKIKDDAGLGIRYADESSGIREVRLDADGKVKIEKKGMSVFRAWREVPLIRRPERLGGPNRGDEDTYCFRLGDGPWESGIILEDKLDMLAPTGNNPNHGVVRPIKLVTLAEYRTHLAETRSNWILDES